MKRCYLVVLFYLIAVYALSAQTINVGLNNHNHFTITENQNESFSFINNLGSIESRIVKTKSGNFVELIIPSYTFDSQAIGEPELPVLNKLIRVPKGSEISFNIVSKQEEIIDLYEYGIDLPILPHQPSLSKGDNIDDVPFYFHKNYYSLDSFKSSELIQFKMLGKMRDQQLARLSINPIDYNPVTNKIKVITRIEVKVSFNKINYFKEKHSRSVYFSPEFENLYKRCINYLPSSNNDVITTYPVKYVIISDPSFQTALQPLIEWKTKKGFTVIEGYTNDPNVGSSTTSIYNFLRDLYINANASNPAPTYLLIVGDHSEVPAFSGNTGTHLSDMYYCEFDGNGDFYPEMYYGRMSATNSGDVEAQVHKTITHETYSFTDPAFLEEIVLVAGVDAAMAPTYGNGQINYGTDYYFDTAHSLVVNNYLYGSGTPITSDMPQASAAIITDISNGSSFANYTAHCGSSGWSDPSFSIADISGLQNIDKYGVMIGNCCQSNDFNVSECFGEALLRANNKGAVGYIGGSNNTYWDEDYWWAVGNTANISANPSYSGTGLGAYDCLMHENGEQKEDWFITQGQIIHSGNLAVTQAGGAEQYYWEIYHVMGDPSLMPYIGIPTQLTVSHILAAPVGTNSLLVNTEENAYVAISMNGILLDAQLADSTGIVNLNFSSLSNVGAADIVVTKQFKQPYINTIQIISPNGPFVIYNSHSIDDITGNNNGLTDYDELINLDVSFQNIGTTNTQNINVKISSNDPYVTLVDSFANITILNSSQISSISSPFSFEVDSFVPDLHTVSFNLIMTDTNMNTWFSNLSVLLHAPILNYNSFIIDDGIGGNGKLDAGETVDLIISAENIGHSEIDSIDAILTTLSPYITINTSNIIVPSLNPGQQQTILFSVSVDPNVPIGTLAEFPFNFTDGLYAFQHIFSETIGIIDEDYETGDFTKYTWIQGLYPWAIDTAQVYEGAYSSRSAIGLPDNQESELSIILDVIAAGDISFYKLLSSELNYDELKFKINGNKVGEWSGIDATWSLITFPVNVGQNVFKWEYEKDASFSDGQDCAWIDYIVFPPINFVSTTVIDREIDIKIYPNPTMGNFRILFGEVFSRSIDIIDPLGRIVKRITTSEPCFDFDISNYNVGIYKIRIMPENIVYLIAKK